MGIGLAASPNPHIFEKHLVEIIMEYYPDLSSFPNMWPGDQSLNLIAIGWLSSEQPHTKGKASAQFIERLELFCLSPMIMTFGVDVCHLCNDTDEPTNSGFTMAKLHSGKEIQLYGEYYLRIPSPNRTKIYATSDFILHYVTEHHYLPPQEFIDAIMSAPLPGTIEFAKFANTWKEDHTW